MQNNTCTHLLTVQLRQTFSGLCFGLSPLWLHDSNSCVCPEMWHNHKPFYSQVCCSGVGRETGWLSTAIRCPRAATALQLPSRHSANWGLIWLAASSLTLHNHLAQAISGAVFCTVQEQFHKIYLLPYSTSPWILFPRWLFTCFSEVSIKTEGGRKQGRWALCCEVKTSMSNWFAWYTFCVRVLEQSLHTKDCIWKMVVGICFWSLKFTNYAVTILVFLEVEVYKIVKS